MEESKENISARINISRDNAILGIKRLESDVWYIFYCSYLFNSGEFKVGN